MGHHGRAYAISDATRHHVNLFRELLDEILNKVLFVLLDLEIVLAAFDARELRRIVFAPPPRTREGAMRRCPDSRSLAFARDDREGAWHAEAYGFSCVRHARL